MSSPTIYLRGIRDIDDKFEKMIAIREACYAAKIMDLPQEVNDYFDGDPHEGVSELFHRKFSHDILTVDAGSGNIMDYGTDRSLLTTSMPEAMEDSRTFSINLSRLPTALKSLQLEISW